MGHGQIQNMRAPNSNGPSSYPPSVLNKITTQPEETERIVLKNNSNFKTSREMQHKTIFKAVLALVFAFRVHERKLGSKTENKAE
jgi:hypothetical protein